MNVGRTLTFVLKLLIDDKHDTKQVESGSSKREEKKQVQMYFVSIGVGGGVLGYLTRCEAPGGVGGRASPTLLLPLGGGVSGNSSLTLNLESISKA